MGSRRSCFKRVVEGGTKLYNKRFHKELIISKRASVEKLTIIIYFDTTSMLALSHIETVLCLMKTFASSNNAGKKNLLALPYKELQLPKSGHQDLFQVLTQAACN